MEWSRGSLYTRVLWGETIKRKMKYKTKEGTNPHVSRTIRSHERFLSDFVYLAESRRERSCIEKKE